MPTAPHPLATADASELRRLGHEPLDPWTLTEQRKIDAVLALPYGAARRDVVMRDGLVRSDRAVSQRLIASDESGKLASVDDLAHPEN